MKSKLEMRIDDIIAFIDACPMQMFSATKVQVSKYDLLDLLEDLRQEIPDELKRYQKLLDSREAILKDAREKAAEIEKEARAKYSIMSGEQAAVPEKMENVDGTTNRGKTGIKIAVFPGTFDPVTNGHMELILRGAAMFDKLVIGVLENIEKSPVFSVEERIEMLSVLTKDMENVSVTSFGGLLADFVEKEKATAILRGLRSPQDFSYELPLAQANFKLSKHADTVFLATAPEHSYISSSGVKEIFHFGGEIREMVPDIVYERLKEKNH